MDTLRDILARAPRSTPVRPERTMPVARHRAVNPHIAGAFHRGLLRAGWEAMPLGDGFQYRMPATRMAWLDLESAVIARSCRVV